ncbi:ATP-binding protein [Spirulina sp. CCNP1310]|uniref:AAA family ATPase n=1 Tax=Spirulina sp. CCNP1310 TaxID=3110249 RepID=UPI002B20B117|nr:ATP-binding protein [Spirulina sp. CCNP1310]MEA5420171.1 ATP-binding protein [Spirulina sp. CCNP1310]
MLTQIELRNFKSYRSGSLKLGRLTVLIGANASGKSNVIEALHLLARIATGERLSFLASLYPQDQVLRGELQDLGYQGSKTFGIACVTTEPEWQKLSIEFSLEEDRDLHVIQEKITSQTSAVPLYEITSAPQGAGSDLFVAYHNFARGGKKPSIVCSSQMAIFTQLLSEIRFRPENTKSRETIPKIAENYVRYLSNIIFLEPEPILMRSYGHKADQILQKHGTNLSGVIYNLCLNPDLKRLVLDFIQSLPEQDIEDIKFIETPRDEVMLQLVETFGGVSRTYDASLLSDGTLRVLAIAAVMLSAPEQSLVVIEEIDNGVHPSRVADLLARITKIAKDRDLRVLISSHNPALLDALPDEAIPETVFCYRSPRDGSSQLIRLQDIPDYPELIAQGSVGHLMTRGLLERFVKQHPGTDQKKQKAMEWLANLAAVGATGE